MIPSDGTSAAVLRMNLRDRTLVDVLLGVDTHLLLSTPVAGPQLGGNSMNLDETDHGIDPHSL